MYVRASRKKAMEQTNKPPKMHLEHERFEQMDALETIGFQPNQLEIMRGYLRYEALRKLNPRQFQELCRRNIAGEHFDTMIDQLIVNTLDRKSVV